MLSTDGICTLVDMVIVDPTQVDLVFQVVSSHEVAAMTITQAKGELYHDQHLIDTFLPLAIKVFGCLHQ